MARCGISRLAGPLAALVVALPASTVAVRAQSQIESYTWRLITRASATSDSNFLDVTGQTVQLYRVPISYRVRSTEDHRWGLRLTFPFSIGLHQFEVSTPLRKIFAKTWPR